MLSYVLILLIFVSLLAALTAVNRIINESKKRKSAEKKLEEFEQEHPGRSSSEK